MKRNHNHSFAASVFVVFTLVFAAPVPAATQANITEPTPVAKIVEGLCVELGFSAKFDDPIPESIVFQGTIKLEKLPLMLKGLLDRHDFEAEPQGWTMHIRRKGTSPPSPVPQANTQTTETPRDPNRMYYPDGRSVTREEWQMLLHVWGPERLAAQMEGIRRASQGVSYTPDSLPAPSAPLMTPPNLTMNPAPTMNFDPYAPSHLSNPSGGYGYGGYYDPFWMNYRRQYENAGVWGRLKIDGPEGFLQAVHVFVDGHPLSPASKANDRTNEGLAIPVGNHDVQLMWLDKNEVKVLSWRGYTIRPMMVQKTNWVGGKKEIYDRAPKATPEEEAMYRDALGLTVGTMR